MIKLSSVCGRRLVCGLTAALILFGGFESHQASAQIEGTVEKLKAGLTVRDLRCAYLKNPLGIDDLKPRLSWKLAAVDKQARGKRQIARQILVASSAALLSDGQGDLWDSGKIDTDQSIHVTYGGKPLQSRMFCWWKVRVWDENGRVSQWSEPAFWSMGLLREDDWNPARWIGLNEASEQIKLTDLKKSSWLWYPEGKPQINAPVATRYFRRTLPIPKGRRIKRAMVFFAGDDQCVFYVNGAQVGVSRGHPNLIGLDLKHLLKPGKNSLAVAATNLASVPQNPGGWIGAVRVEFEKGSPLIVYSDNGWKCTKKATDHWESIDYDDSNWVAAKVLGKAGMSPWGDPWGNSWHTEHRRLAGRYLRREFQAAKRVRRATAYVCGLGFFDLHINGQLIGNQLMNPALTGYNQRALYVSFDVSEQIRQGENAVGVELSNGRFFAPRSQTPVKMHTYGYPQLLMQIHIQYEDGSQETIPSDELWKVTTKGPTRASSEFDGEEYDARMEMAGWAAAGFDDSAWRSVQLVDAPGGKLEAQMVEPIRVTETLRPKRITHPKPGVYMLDFGQAFYGVVKIKASAAAGTQVSMRTSFNITEEGTLNYLNDRSANNTDIYTFKGEGIEEWHPRFRGNATRWVQVEGFPGEPTAENFVGLVTHTDHEKVGQFVCSNQIINRTYLNARWGTRMQNRSVPMEPDRDERMPWSGHPAKTSESEGWAFNVAPFYEHFLHNYRVHQEKDGSLQEILPPYWTFNSRDIIWPSVVTIIPDWYYNFYGDDRLLRDNYEMMKRFVDYHVQTNLKPDFTMDHCNYGDWVDTASIGANSRNFGATSRPLMGTAYLYNNCRIVQRAAKLLGHEKDEQHYGALAEKMRNGFNKRFFDPKTNSYESQTQCSYHLPLAFGMVPAKHRQAVIANLAEDILVKHKGHTTVGLIGTQWQMQTLSSIGRNDAAYAIATRTARPSWGYMIEHGATTIWERWDTDTQDGGMNGESQKILSGNYEAWCYQALGGINYDPQNPGFKHIVLKPQIVGDLQWVRSSHRCMYGEIKSDWKLENGTLNWQITVPPNTMATVVVPSVAGFEVTESGHPAAKTPGVKFLRRERSESVFRVGSGSYHFSSYWTPAE